jgi:hypothetical protein
MKAFSPILALAGLLLATSCEDPTLNVAAADSCSDDVVRKDVQAQGIMLFDKQEQVYAIHSNVPGTPDSKIIAFVCGPLSEAFHQDSLPVSYTGTYSQFSKYSPTISGQEYYYVSLSKIELVTGE